MVMKLKQLLADIEVLSFLGDNQAEITEVVYDSRKAVPGALFVCIRGQQADGNKYIAQAVQAGVKAIVTEEMPEIPMDHLSVVLVKDSRIALAGISATWFHYPARQMTVIGLTGTKGKTTTTHMIKKILEEAGKKVGMIGTVGAFVGEEKITLKNTTPESYELHSLFAHMLEEGCSHVVMEVSSQGLKQGRTKGICFDYGAFLNISPDHIGEGEHADFAEYLACKKMMFSQCKQVVANIDDLHWKEIVGEQEELITISTSTEADFMGEEIQNIWEPGVLGVSFQLKKEGQRFPIALHMPGRFNVENALVAIAITSSLGVGIEAIQAALKKVLVKGRTQVLKDVNFSTFLIDYAHNALSMESLLQTLKAYQPKRLICLFGGGGNKPKQRRFDMGEIAGKYADLSILTMDNPRYETVEQINQDIIEGMKVYNGNYKVIVDRKEAIHYLMDHCGKGDIVALIGKGHESYQEIQGVKHYFSEEEVVSEYLMEK